MVVVTKLGQNYSQSRISQLGCSLGGLTTMGQITNCGVSKEKPVMKWLL